MAHLVEGTLNWFCGCPRRRGGVSTRPRRSNTSRHRFARAEYRSLVTLGLSRIHGAGRGNEPNRSMRAGSAGTRSGHDGS